MYSSQKALDLQLLNHKKVGILGGSFNPAHIGHLEMSKYALKELGLDYVIWLVTPQNPLKPPYEKSLKERADFAIKVANHPKILVSCLEEEIKSSSTYDTLLYLCKNFPGTEFTWLMGADCVAQFHLWENFDKFTDLANVAIFDRKGYADYQTSCPAGKWLQKEQLKNGKFRVLFCHNKLVDISSTEIRNGKK